ncbi:TadE/TadG family type IV pilus assembly protein [Roseococcus sp. DSY-14]|uniref:TadE/TadG family type IV pilus assembly protein n=1 Tax=Roseococcus sp. DSY-14 TaxID=3369650 RepID=UPI00387B0B42
MNLTRALERDRRGIAAAEFALILPFLLVLALGAAEATAHLRAWYRLERAAAAAADAGARAEAMTRDAVGSLFEVARLTAAPYAAWSRPGDATAARMVVSVIAGSGGRNVVSWSCGRGAAAPAATLAAGGALPGGLSVPPGESLLVVEVANATAPWRILSARAFFGTAGPPVIRAHAVARPRTAELAVLQGGCP